jgi:hypothetical protein
MLKKFSQKVTYVSEESVASIFRVKKQAGRQNEVTGAMKWDCERTNGRRRGTISEERRKEEEIFFSPGPTVFCSSAHPSPISALTLSCADLPLYPENRDRIFARKFRNNQPYY